MFPLAQSILHKMVECRCCMVSTLPKLALSAHELSGGYLSDSRLDQFDKSTAITLFLGLSKAGVDSLCLGAKPVREPSAGVQRSLVDDVRINTFSISPSGQVYDHSQPSGATLELGAYRRR